MYRNHILPSTCIHPACRNIEVKKEIRIAASGYLGEPARKAVRWLGTTPN
jgi:hypothetical protein